MWSQWTPSVARAWWGHGEGNNDKCGVGRGPWLAQLAFLPLQTMVRSSTYILRSMSGCFSTNSSGALCDLHPGGRIYESIMRFASGRWHKKEQLFIFSFPRQFRPLLGHKGLLRKRDRSGHGVRRDVSWPQGPFAKAGSLG